jgi:rhodanese-related sulfurtransferase
MNPILREMAGVLLAAACLGLAYNAASPLGVSLRVASDSPVAAAHAPLALPDPDLQNETTTAVIVASGPPAPGAPQLPASMAWAEVKPLLARGEIVLVDARDAVAYDAGHIPGAVSLPLRSLAENAAAFAAQHPKTRPLVIYCGSIGCPLAQVLARQLRADYGYTDVREMPGGYVEWRTVEGPR